MIVFAPHVGAELDWLQLTGTTCSLCVATTRTIDSTVARAWYSCYGEHSHTKIAPLVTKITYIKMDPLRSIRNGFVHGNVPILISMPHGPLGMSLQ